MYTKDISERSFIIRFEEDDLPPEVRSRAFFTRHSDANSSTTSVSAEPDYLVVESEVSDSYLSAVLSTIQPLDDSKSLLILAITCHPAPERRFENATLTWHVSRASPDASPSPTSSATPSQGHSPPPSPHLEKSPLLQTGTHHSPHSKPPRIFAIAPQHSIGGWTEEQTRLLWGLKAPAEFGAMGASVGIEPSVEKEKTKGVVHAMTILGSVRGGGVRATWTIEENKSSERGIPSHFQLALVLNHDGPFAIELDIKAELAGGIWPCYLRSGQKLKKTIDVETWKCGDVTWEPGEVGWKNYVAGLTGEVPGLVLDFEQKIVRP